MIENFKNDFFVERHQLRVVILNQGPRLFFREKDQYIFHAIEEGVKLVGDR